jgi:hypothetical protein
MFAYTRLFTDPQGMARFEEVEVALEPHDPAPGELSMSEPMPATAVLFGRAPAGGSHPEQPEGRRQRDDGRLHGRCHRPLVRHESAIRRPIDVEERVVASSPR